MLAAAPDEPDDTTAATASMPAPLSARLQLVKDILQCPHMYQRVLLVFVLTLIFLLAVVITIAFAAVSISSHARKVELGGAVAYAASGAGSAALVYAGTKARDRWKARRGGKRDG